MPTLPARAGTLEPDALAGDPLIPRAPRVPLIRTAFAAGHVVSDPLRERTPWDTRPAVGWEATRVRGGLRDQGLGLAEAMDTAQGGVGVDWPTAREPVERAMRALRAPPMRPRVASGAGTDHVPLAAPTDADAIVAACETQMEATGTRLILMATRALPAIGADADTYEAVSGHLIAQARVRVILHWLGDMFDPMFAGYWGSHDVAAATETALALIRANPAKGDGIKISLLDEAHEVACRARLPEGVRLYTGDDFNDAPLIAGDGTHHSHARLGVFAAIAPAASQALEALTLGDRATYEALLEPAVPVSREFFRAPTRSYRARIAVLAWLHGSQSHVVMPAGFQSSRDITQYAEVFRLADRARLWTRPDLAEARMRTPLALRGIE